MYVMAGLFLVTLVVGLVLVLNRKKQDKSRVYNIENVSHNYDYDTGNPFGQNVSCPTCSNFVVGSNHFFCVSCGLNVFRVYNFNVATEESKYPTYSEVVRWIKNKKNTVEKEKENV
jgi:hypothetical protein